MKFTSIALSLSLILSTASYSAPIFDGTTLDKEIESKNEVHVKREKSKAGTDEFVVYDNNEKVEMLDINKYFDLKVKKDKNGKVESFSFDKEKVDELFKISAPFKVGTMMAFERNGKLAFVSENQRYYFIGEVYDMFNGMRKIKTIDDVKKFANRINYKTIGVDINTLNSTSVGNGTNEVVIWVAPDSPFTRTIIDQAVAISKKDSKYKFYFVVISTGSEESFNLTKKFFCAREDGNTRIGNMLYEGSLDTLTNTNCPITGFEKTLAIKYMSDVDMVPFVVAHDGRVSRGVPAQGLEQFLNEANSQNGSINNDDEKQLKIRKELEKKISEQALQDDAENEEADVDYNTMESKNPEVVKKHLIEEQVDAIKEKYEARFERINNRIEGEDTSYEREKERVFNAQEQVQNDNRMDPAVKNTRLKEFGKRLSKIDEKHSKTIEQLNKEKKKLLKQQKKEIEAVSDSYVNEE